MSMCRSVLIACLTHIFTGCAVAVVLFLLTGCCLFNQITSVEHLPDAAPGIWIEPLGAVHTPNNKTGDDKSKYRFKKRMHETTEYEYLIQIVHSVNTGETLVEVFHTPNGVHATCRYDHHWSSRSHVHKKFFVYPGTVEGADWRGGFAMLAESEIGEQTDVDSSVNAEHQKHHKIQGRVIEADRSLGIWWELKASPNELKITIPPDRVVTRR